jgi:hypothetical protein
MDRGGSPPGRDQAQASVQRPGPTSKNFVDPQELDLRLRRLGWDCAIRRDSSRWVYGQARLAK